MEKLQTFQSFIKNLNKTLKILFLQTIIAKITILSFPYFALTYLQKIAYNFLNIKSTFLKFFISKRQFLINLLIQLLIIIREMFTKILRFLLFNKKSGNKHNF